MSFENELRERLHDSASRIDVDDDLFARAEQLHQRHVRKVQLGGALGVAAVLALGVVAGPWLADRFDPSPAPIIGERGTPGIEPGVVETTDPDVTEDPGTTGDPATEGPAPTVGWAPIPRSPIGDGWYLTAWTGDELYVLGTAFADSGASGDVDVFAYRPDDGTWRSVSAPPIARPYGSQLLWTGTEVVLLGGDPVDDETGDAVGSPTVEGWAYEPGANSWRQLPEAPLAPRVEFTATWTGDELIVWGGFSDSWNSETGSTDVTTYADGAAWDPATNTWRTLAPSPLEARGFHGAVWNGRRLVVFGGGSTEEYESEMFIERGFDDAAVYDPASDTWATITSPGPIGPLVAYAWSGDRILYWTGHLGDDRGGNWLEPGAVWDPIDGASEPLPVPPFDVRRDGGVDSTWVDGVGWLVWGGGCGEGCNQSFREGAIFDPEAGTWTRLVPPEGEVGFGATGVWLGDRLMTLGGSRESYSPEITTDTAPMLWTPSADAG